LGVAGEAERWVTSAGDFARLTGEPVAGEPVLLSLRNLSFCNKHK